VGTFQGNANQNLVLNLKTFSAIITILAQINKFECQNCLFDQPFCTHLNNRVESNGENQVEYFPCIGSKLKLNLMSVTITGINWKHLPSRIFPGLNVSRLILSFNNIESIADDALDEVSDRLQTLSLEYNQIESINEKHFRKLTKVKYLFLQKNRQNKVPRENCVYFLY